MAEPMSLNPALVAQARQVMADQAMSLEQRMNALLAAGVPESALPAVAVAGLMIPLPLAVRIVAAIRGQYGALTLDLSDEAAMRAFLRYIITYTLMSWESSQFGQQVEAEIDQVRKEAQDKADAAARKAQLDAEKIVDAPAPSTELYPATA